DANARFYEGQLKGSLVLSGEDDVRYAIKVVLSEINGALLGRAMPIIPVRKGKWTASCAITSMGTTLDVFLKQLRGSARVDGKHGELALLGSKRLPFSSCQVKLDPLRSGQWRSSVLGLDGLWQCDLDQSVLKAHLEANGKIFFGKTKDKSGVEIPGLETHSKLVLKEASETDGKRPAIEGKGLLQWPSSQGGLRVTESTLRLPQGSFSGQLLLGSQKESVLQIMGQWQMPDLSSCLGTLFGRRIALPSFLNEFTGKASLQLAGSLITLSEVEGKTKLGPLAGVWALNWERPWC
ncbi:MAG: hypothetical protein J5803_02400, partial [Desulfovibrio sp.]|nr:hypothetical protein [Desulfovibrio sp.]